MCPEILRYCKLGTQKFSQRAYSVTTRNFSGQRGIFDYFLSALLLGLSRKFRFLWRPADERDTPLNAI